MPNFRASEEETAESRQRDLVSQRGKGKGKLGVSTRLIQLGGLIGNSELPTVSRESERVWLELSRGEGTSPLGLPAAFPLPSLLSPPLSSSPLPSLLFPFFLFPLTSLQSQAG